MIYTGPADRNRQTLTYDLKRAVDEACSEVMNRLAPGCPPLYWSPSSGDPYYGMSGLASEGHYTTEAAACQVREWAEKFDLHPTHTPARDPSLPRRHPRHAGRGVVGHRPPGLRDRRALTHPGLPQTTTHTSPDT